MYCSMAQRRPVYEGLLHSGVSWIARSTRPFRIEDLFRDEAARMFRRHLAQVPMGTMCLLATPGSHMGLCGRVAEFWQKLKLRLKGIQ